MDRKRTSALLTLSLLASMVVTTTAAMPAAAEQPPCREQSRSATSALAMAEQCGIRVENLAERTETTQVFANPEGHWTSEQSLRPRWVRGRDGAWVDADATLRFNADGTVSPVAAVFPMTFSGGGTAPLAVMRKPGHAMSLTWPGRLPEPHLTGNVATYPEVLPGVDLQVRAEVDGFMHLLVVKSATAAANPALRKIRFGIDSDTLSFRQDGARNVTAADSNGQAWFTSASAMMWDSRGAADPSSRKGEASARSEQTQAADHPRSAGVGTRISNGVLELEPDQELLGDPRAQFPIYIDPGWTGNIKDNAFTMVWSRSDTENSSFWQRTNALNNGDYKGEMGAGRTCDSSSNGSCTSTPYVIRSFFRMNISGVSGKHILGAKFSIEQRWAWRCFSTNYTKLWITGAIGSSTTWNNQPSWDSAYTAETVGNHKASVSSGCGGVGTIEFGVRHFIERAHGGGWSDLTVGLRPANESDVAYWKRFRYNSPRLSIDYNSYPTVGDRSTSPATACVSGGSTPSPDLPLINDASPDLRVVTNDADTENDLKGHFQIQQRVLKYWSASTSFTDSIGRANGGTSVVTPVLESGTYRWRVRIADPWSYAGSSGTDYSALSSWCEFKVDVTPPDVVASSPEYPKDCAPCGGVGTTGRFTITSSHSDVVGYWWGFSDPPGNWAAGSTATIDWTPTRGGPRTLYIKSKDEAGNVSARHDYAFTVDDPDPVRAHWRLVEGPGAVEFVDSSGNGFNATPVGGVALGQVGRYPSSAAALFDGVDDQADTGSPVIADTSKSFSVSAWVNLASKSNGSHTILGQGGTNNSAFVLEYVKSDTVDVWKFTAPTSDSATASYPGAESINGAPQEGRWTHLAGVYDSAAKTMKLYVDGVLVQTARGVTTWKANGALKIGGSQRWHGHLSDVRVWQRVLFDSEIKDMIDPVGAKVGEYHFNEVDSPFALDSSDSANDLTLNGGATIPASGAGYDGTGMLLLDRTGEAVAYGPSVYTSQSFTASAWVRMDGTSLPTTNDTVVSQSGSKVSAFFLGYRYESATGTSRWRFYLPGSDADGGGASGGATALSAPITTDVLGKWVHLQGTYDAATGAVRLYVNGALASSVTRSTPMWDAAGPLIVGAAVWTSSTGGSPYVGYRWNGAVDEVRVFAGALYTPAADWRFDSCTGTPVKCENSADPGTHQVTLSGGAAWDPDGYGEGSGLVLDGTGKAVTDTAAVDTSKSFTVSAWVKLTDTSSSRCAVCFEGTLADAFVLGYRSGVNTWQFWGNPNDGTGTETVATSSIAAQLNTWTHLTGVYDAIRGEIRLYVNGQPAGSADYTEGWTTGNVVIGREKWQGNEINYWMGAVDEVRLSQHAPSSGVGSAWTRGTYNTGSVLRSETNNFELRMQVDGNLVLYHGETPQWSTETGGNSGAYAVLQADGNFVVYASDGTSLWDTGTWGTTGDRLVLHNDGDLVLYGQGNQILWRR